jgi:hypothetical protein
MSIDGPVECSGLPCTIIPEDGGSIFLQMFGIQPKGHIVQQIRILSK